MSNQVNYSFRTDDPERPYYLKEVEHGSADWDYIRTRPLALADEIGAAVAIYLYNDALRKWDYIGQARPGGEWYNFKGNGPYYYDPERHSFYEKKGGEQ